METPLLDGIQKKAVTLSQLRKATSSLGNRLIKKRGLNLFGDIVRRPSKWSKTNFLGIPTMAPFTGVPRKMFSNNARRALIQSGMETQADLDKVMAITKRFKGKIFNAGDANNYLRATMGSKIRKLTTPVSREAFNRSVILHEVAEAGRHPGKFKVFGHGSLKPMLQDLNIAATLKGPGSAAKHAIRDMRADEIAILHKAVPWSKELNLGYNRINRHMIKKIQLAYEKALMKNPNFSAEELIERMR